MKYFTIAELIRSANAIQKRIWNATTRENEDNLVALVDAILDPIREKMGKPINVTSGFRNPQVNRACNGEATSQHLRGEAVDIVIGNAHDNYRMGMEIIRQGKFDQLIFENVQRGDLSCEWVHVSYKRSGVNRHEIRYKVKGREGYPCITAEIAERGRY